MKTLTINEAKVLQYMKTRTYKQSPSNTHIYTSHVANATNLSGIAAANCLRSLQTKGFVKHNKVKFWWTKGTTPKSMPVMIDIESMTAMTQGNIEIISTTK